MKLLILKRRKTLTAALLAVTFLTTPLQTFAIEQSDLPLDLRGHWSSAYAITMLEHGVVSGYPNGRFYPDQSMSREEAASLLYELLLIKIGSVPRIRYDDPPYTDVSGRWSLEMITALWQAGILEDSTAFSPSTPISRGDMARYTALSLQLLERKTQKETSLETLKGNLTAADITETSGEMQSDVTTTAPAEETEEASPNKDYILYLYEKGIISGYDDGNFYASRTLSRAEAITILYRSSGFPLTSTNFAPLPSYNVISVPYISQLYPVYAPVGCEPTSLLMGLKAKGYAQDVNLEMFLDAMPKTGSNPAKGFAGSPYVADPTKKIRTTIYPPVLAAFAQQYGNVIDISGASPLELQQELLAGNPVVAYVTLYWENPFYRYYEIEGETQRLLSNNHAVLVCGYNAETHEYYIADPYNINNTRADYFYWISGGTFDRLYLERCHALAVS